MVLCGRPVNGYPLTGFAKLKFKYSQPFRTRASSNVAEARKPDRIYPPSNGPKGHCRFGQQHLNKRAEGPFGPRRTGRTERRYESTDATGCSETFRSTGGGYTTPIKQPRPEQRERSPKAQGNEAPHDLGDGQPDRVPMDQAGDIPFLVLRQANSVGWVVPFKGVCPVIRRYTFRKGSRKLRSDALVPTSKIRKSTMTAGVSPKRSPWDEQNMPLGNDRLKNGRISIKQQLQLKPATLLSYWAEKSLRRRQGGRT
uniref:Uncharacterized protein n=1 Tax=Trichuris muris TaxID=70415 RepID=A0A5S6Q5E7_TRIMR